MDAFRSEVVHTDPSEPEPEPESKPEPGAALASPSPVVLPLFPPPPEELPEPEEDAPPDCEPPSFAFLPTLLSLALSSPLSFSLSFGERPAGAASPLACLTQPYVLGRPAAKGGPAIPGQLLPSIPFRGDGTVEL
ncbi:hypothetical protein ACTWQF_27475 [Streptomyces sp. 8N114]|uniref:hypothetical protein n=1 Tax=Streptomyces sp. 8N114 TaxID=3457419 RepID=UPI003FD3D4EA